MVAASEFREVLDKRWGGDQLGFAIWEWHAGARQVYNAVQTYVENTTGEKLGDITDKNLSDQQAAKLILRYRQVIEELKINAFNIIQNDKVKAEYSDVNFDFTLEYVERVTAAYKVWEDSKK